MSCELILARFDEGEAVLSKLADTARSVFRQSGQDENAVFLSPDGEMIQIDLPDGTAEIYKDHATFPIEREFDTFTAELIFGIAQAGDLVTLTEGGDYHAILVNSAQYSLLPKEWQRIEMAPVCYATEHFRQYLEGWRKSQRQYIDQATGKMARVEATHSGSFASSGIPGTRPAPGKAIYVEALAKETDAIKHQKKVYKFHSDVVKRHPARFSRELPGIMKSEFWRLETPFGQVFYVYGYGGQIEAWEFMFNELSKTEGRILGRIENFDTFIQSDGKKIPLGECLCARIEV